MLVVAFEGRLRQMTRWFPSTIFTATTEPPHFVFVLAILPDSGTDDLLEDIFLSTFLNLFIRNLRIGSRGRFGILRWFWGCACWGVDGIGVGEGVSVTLSAETRTWSNPCWRITKRHDHRTRVLGRGRQLGRQVSDLRLCRALPVGQTPRSQHPTPYSSPGSSGRSFYCGELGPLLVFFWQDRAHP
jgi:hypothetical protein